MEFWHTLSNRFLYEDIPKTHISHIDLMDLLEINIETFLMRPLTELREIFLRKRIVSYETCKEYCYQITGIELLCPSLKQDLKYFFNEELNIDTWYKLSNKIYECNERKELSHIDFFIMLFSKSINPSDIYTRKLDELKKIFIEMNITSIEECRCECFYFLGNDILCPSLEQDLEYFLRI